MSDQKVRDLGQRYLAAARETSHTLTTVENPYRELDELLIAVEEHLDQLTGLRLHLLQEAWALGAGQVLDREKTSARTTTAQATAALKLALDFEDRFALIGRALSDGKVSLAQAEAIVAGLRRLPATLTRSDLDTAQATVLGYADTLGPAELRTLASRMTEVLDPAGAEQAEADRLAREERLARNGRFLKLRPDHHGSLTITGRLPVTDGALLAAQIEALMPPLSSYRASDELPGPEARRADALVLLTQQAASSGTLPAQGMDRPTAKITIPLTTLTTGVGPAAVLDNGEPISAGEARRLACDADIIPITLGTRSEILDIGQPHRLFTKGLRTALTVRDQGCAFPHCDAPAAACEGHHIIPWHQGGETKLSNLASSESTLSFRAGQSRARPRRVGEGQSRPSVRPHVKSRRGEDDTSCPIPKSVDDVYDTMLGYGHTQATGVHALEERVRTWISTFSCATTPRSPVESYSFRARISIACRFNLARRRLM